MDDKGIRRRKKWEREGRKEGRKERGKEKEIIS